MALRKHDPQAVESEVAALGGLDLPASRERWQQLFGNAPPKSLRLAFLIKACAHQIQVNAFGGLSAATKRRLRQIAEATRMGTSMPAAASSRRIKPGARLVRAWRGKTHTVNVLADGGFEWDGAHYRSLSGVAHAITGTSWNGHTFFGLKKRAAGQVAGAPETDAAAGAAAARAGTRGRSARGRQVDGNGGVMPDGSGRPATIRKRPGKMPAASEASTSASPASSGDLDPTLEVTRHG